MTAFTRKSTKGDSVNVRVVLKSLATLAAAALVLSDFTIREGGGA